MGVGMTKVLHVKIPVTDLQRSVDWYARLMDLVLSREFIEDGELRGAALHSREGGFAFALRLREHCSSQPALDGFDVAALRMATRPPPSPPCRRPPARVRHGALAARLPPRSAPA